MQRIGTSLEIIRKELLSKNETLGVAESVTAGNLQAAFSLAKGATEFFQGGLTAYNNGQKARHLHVDPILGEKTNCVSDKIAQSMALGACRFFSSNWGIGITGYAAPVPAWHVRNKLFAWLSIAHNETIVLTQKIEISKKPMEAVQQFYVKAAIDFFAGYVRSVE